MANSKSARRPRLRPAALLAAFLFALGLVVAVSAVTSQSAVCVSCHHPQAAALHTTAHTTLDCYQCHLDDGLWSLLRVKADEFFVMYPAAVTGGRRWGPSERVSRSACTRCHGRDIAGRIDHRGLRIVHDSCAAAPAKCDSCHTAIAHPGQTRWPRAPVMDECVACHNKEAVATKCDRCHTGKLETERLKTGVWQVTHGPNWRITHGMGDLDTCKTCHRKSKCISCHNTELPHPANFIASHGKQALDRKTAKCMRCHKSKGFCDGCHGIDMPHPKGFLPRHPKLAEARDDPKCLKCHRRDDCSRCHVWHTHPGATDGNLRANLPSTREEP